MKAKNAERNETAFAVGLITLPLHVYLVYRHAKNGASRAFLS